MRFTPSGPHCRIYDGNDTTRLLADTENKGIKNVPMKMQTVAIFIGTLLVVIGFIIQNCHRPIDLLDKDQADHLMGKSHFA